MSLDQNLFTLNIVPSEVEPDAVDLVEPNGIVHYRKRRVVAAANAAAENAAYNWSLYGQYAKYHLDARS